MNKNFYLTVSALFVAINMVMASIAYYLKIPIYMDTFGTMLGVRLLGLHYGIGIAVVSALVNSNFDIFALYFLPTHIVTSIMLEIIIRKGKMGKWNDFLKAAFIGIPAAIVGAMITAYIFGGITSAGSSIILSFLSKTGLSLVVSAFVVQIATDYLDKFIMLKLINTVMGMVPNRILEKFRRI